jgi:DNA-binding NarL/FixJ family response regulator
MTGDRGSTRARSVHHFQRRILIVEDDAFMGSLMAGALAHEGLETELASCAVSAKCMMDRFDPDAVLVDIDLGDGPSGIDFVQMVARTRPEVASILLSKHPDQESAGFAESAIPEGVAYLRKSLIHDTAALVVAIDEVLRGAGTMWRHDRASKGQLDLLTRAQREILHMMALGLSNAEIARRRDVSVSNVEQRVSEVFKSLDLAGNAAVAPRVEAVRQYFAAGGLPGINR